MQSKPLLDRFPGKLLSALLASLLLVPPAMADEDAAAADSGRLRLSGFATLGLTYNDNRDAGAIFAVSQKRPARYGLSGNLDTVGGVQLEWQPLQDTSVVVQGVARAGDDLQPRLRMAYVRQALGSATAVRVGRLRSPLFFDSDVSEIGYANLMVRPPMPLYGVMNSVASIDGLDLQWRHSFGNTAVMAQGFYGKTGYTQRFYNTDPVSTADAEFNGIRGLALSATLPNFTVRASRSWVDNSTMRSAELSQLDTGLTALAGGVAGMAANPLLPAPMAAALAGQAQQIAGYTTPFDGRPIYTSIGFDANLDAWRLLGEWTQLKSGSAAIGKYEGFHLTLAYAIGDFTPYFSYARLDRKDPKLDTSALAPTGLDPTLDAGLVQMKAGLDQATQLTDLTMHSASVGVRWDFRENMALKAQFDRLKTPSPMTPGFFALSTLPFDNEVNLFTVALDVVF